MVQHHAHVVVAAEGVVPGKPVHQDGWCLGQHRHGLRHLLLVGAPQALGVDDGLGQLGRAAGEEELGDGVRASGGHGGVHGGGGCGGDQIGKVGDAAAFQFTAGQHHFNVRIHCGMDGFAVARCIGCKHQAGCHGAYHVLELVKVLAHQRVGR